MATFLSAQAETPWWTAVGIAAAAHVAAISAVLAVQNTPPEPLPDPVMIVELPAGAAAASALSAPQLQEQPQQAPQAAVQPISVPETSAPLPRDPVILPTPRPQLRNFAAPVPQPVAKIAPAASAPPARIAPPAPPTGSAQAGGGPGLDAKAKAAQDDWYALLSAHLNRNKRYPREAKKAELQGTPVVRFAVDRRGRVSDVAIATSSGHAMLDEATLDLMRRVSPLPAMPRSMTRESVTITLPIDYSLSRK